MVEKDFAFERVEKMVKAGMYEGNMHKCLRDAGRLAGGFKASGLLSGSDVDQLGDTAASMAMNQAQARQTWAQSVQFGGGQPLSIEKRESPQALSWDSEIGPAYKVKGIDFVEPLPDDKKEPVKDLIKYLSALYKADDVVAYVTKAFADGDKFKPSGRGQYKRTAGDIITALKKHNSIESALESYDKAAGAWGRLNPLTGEGIKNDDVVDLRHVLIESDEIPVEQQLATLRQINLPCAAIVHSGGKSIHAIVKVDAGQDKALYRERVKFLFELMEKNGFPVDTQNSNSSRLSRWPGFTRGDNTQYLISVNEGPATWQEFETAQKAGRFKFERWAPSYIMEEHEDDSLAGDRFFVKHGSWMIVAQSGVGKSVLAMQIAASFAIGRRFFDIEPVAPMKVVMIQAENNVIDCQEPLRAMRAIMTEEQVETAEKNLVIITASRYAGAEFCEFLRYLVASESPQVIIIDPLLSFSRGDISKMENCNEFLRHQIDPILKENDIGLIALHHTGKPPKDQTQRLQGGDLSYLGIGSSDLTNWARAISVITEADQDRFLFAHPKRGGKLPRQKIYLERGKEDVRWYEADSQEDPEPPQKRQGKYDGLSFEYISGMTNEDLGKKIEHHFPREKMDKNRLALEKKGFIKFDYESKRWTGRAANDFENFAPAEVEEVEKDSVLPF